MFKRVARSMVAAVAVAIATGLMSSPAPSHAQPAEADDKERSFINSDGWTIEEARRLFSAQPGVQ